jgi:hypothetical protein
MFKNPTNRISPLLYRKTSDFCPFLFQKPNKRFIFTFQKQSKPFYMPKKSIFILFLAFASSLFAQKEYFQQQVNYKINVNLDDKKHNIKGNVEMEYINNSPDELKEIWVHLWGNAYKNQRSAYAKQQLNQNKTKFFSAKNEDLGF